MLLPSQTIRVPRRSSLAVQIAGELPAFSPIARSGGLERSSGFLPGPTDLPPAGDCFTTPICPGERIIELPDFDGDLGPGDYLAVDSLDQGTRRIAGSRITDLARLPYLDQELNILTSTEDDYAIVNHGLGSIALWVTQYLYLENLWTIFGAPWQVLDLDNIRFSFAHGFRERVRVVIHSVNP